MPAPEDSIASTVYAWIVDNLWGIIVYAVFSILAWLKLGEVKDVKKMLKEHLSAENPHQNCPVHATTMQLLLVEIREVKDAVKTLDNRVFQMVSAKPNGDSKDDNVQGRSGTEDHEG